MDRDEDNELLCLVPEGRDPSFVEVGEATSTLGELALCIYAR
jgi:hypothetical protein